MNHLTIKDMTITGMMTAILCILSIIPTPFSFFGVPMTLQTFAVALVAYVLGSKLASLSTLIYLLLGLVGIPVYNGAQAGPAVLFGVTGGFIFGFILEAAFTGAFVAKPAMNKTLQNVRNLGFGILGLALCHLFGVIQFMIVWNQTSAGNTKSEAVNLITSFLMVSLPYIPKDIVSVIVAYFLSLALRRALSSANLLVQVS